MMLLVETVFLLLVSRRHRNEGEIFKMKLNDADGHFLSEAVSEKFKCCEHVTDTFRY